MSQIYVDIEKGKLSFCSLLLMCLPVCIYMLFLVGKEEVENRYIAIISIILHR